MRPVNPDINKFFPPKLSTGSSKETASGVLSLHKLINIIKKPGNPELPISDKLKLVSETIGLKPSTELAFVLSALMAEGLKLDKDLIIKILNTVLSRKKDPVVARILARAEAAGLDTADTKIIKMLDFVTGQEAADSPGDKGSEQPGNKQQTANFFDKHSKLLELTEFDKKGAIFKIAQELRSLANKTLLNLEPQTLNKTGKNGAGWLLIPFEFLLDGMSFYGFFRICYYNNCRLKSFIADIRFGDQKRILELSGPGSKPTIKFGTTVKEESRQFLNHFSEIGQTSVNFVDLAYYSELENQKVVHEEA